MTIGHHLKEFHGLPVFDFPDEKARVELPAADAVAWRISAPTYGESGDEQWVPRFERFLRTVDASRVRALVVGCWEEAYETSSAGVLTALIGGNNRLSALEAVFVGDMTFEDCEISWIVQSDVTPLLAAYPRLRRLGVRGGTDLAFPSVRHTGLEALTVETGGLPAEVVRGIVGSDLPALQDLELWLGTDEYGGDSTPEDLAPVLDGSSFPALRRLALRNSVIQDAVAAAVAGAPVVARLDRLDLSMGVLTDEGATALLDGQPLTHLSHLDLSHHYLSDAVRLRVLAALEPHGVTVELGDAEKPEEDDDEVFRYVAVAE
ncbi:MULTISPECIES: STM4015 family protein [unclassified Streptomyces]|uniref:STM4015 family protein n=1 Tax=unclassified Streptomyces TaxID=2593676 RepID=UPI001661217F|nr:MULTISPECIES: STM4015 family protein [unclassified Streptomyces]MBD0710229.1 cytoplasmic protein [Streptomyces sp. CBMA291]MBD0715757.1 cytoplasmic protein [Streptomyces sp. CBMA370]